jgi:hypothetical protein
MEIVIDANVIAEYYRRKACPDMNSGYTADPKPIFDNLHQQGDQVVFDGGHIDQEWRSVIGDAHLRNLQKALHQRGGVRVVPLAAGTCEGMIQALWRIGFPRGDGECRGECVWYLRAAKSSSNLDGWGYIVTEDVDFYDPEEKACGYRHRQRTEILTSRRGPVVEYLYDHESVSIHCIETYIRMYLHRGAQQ